MQTQTTQARCCAAWAHRIHLPRALFVAVLCLFLPQAWGQALSGISGTVTDSTGAVVPNADVTATNVQTHVASHATSTSAGTYRFTDITPGDYNVRVVGKGFSPYTLNGVHVDVATVATANAALQNGSESTSVEVDAPAITLETTQPELGTTIENELVKELPVELAGRDRQIDNFIFLAPGVSGSGFSHRIDGGVDQENEVVFNGIPAVQSETQGYQTNINPPFELVGQFQILQNVFPAQYGLAQGVAAYQFNSGTNALHADAFEILRNSYFDAAGVNPQVNPYTGNLGPATDRENNYGFSAGGPVVIPKIYNGRDKTFFWVSTDYYRFNQGITTNLTVPTQAMVSGDFSAFPQRIYVPNSGLVAGCNPGAAPGQQFPGNIIPQSCISANAKTLLPLVPVVTGNNFTNNTPSQVTSDPSSQDNWGFNIDEKITSSQSVHASFWRDSFQSFAYDHPGYFTNVLSAQKLEPTVGTGFFATYTGVVNPHLVVTGGVGYLGELNNEFNTHTGYSFAPAAGSTTLPTINFSGFDAPTSWGVNSNGETFSINRKLGVSIVNNWLLTHGNQTINFGVEVRRAFQDDHECQQCDGQFTFSQNTTSNGDQNTQDALNQNNTGSPFASFLLGDVDSANRVLASENKLRNLYFAPYFQDDIKVSPKLTVNVGVRWDIAEPFTDDTKNNIVFFNPNVANATAISPSTNSSLLGGVSVLGTCSYCVGYDRAVIHWRQVSPRAGFAYQVNSKTVLLGGVALNHMDGGPFEFGTNKVAVNYGNRLDGFDNIVSNGNSTPAYGNWDTRTLALPTPLPYSTGLLNSQSVNSFSRNAGGLPYVTNYNFGIQRELPTNLLLSVSYVGNRVLHLPSTLNNPNQITPNLLNTLCPNNAPGCVLGQAWTSGPAQAVLQAAGYGAVNGYYTPYANFVNDYGTGVNLIQALRPHPQFQTITNDFENAGVAMYNAAQVQAQKRFSNGLTYLVSYTLSKTLANTDSGFGTFNGGALNTYNQRQEFTVADNDQTQIVNVSGVYELPIGPGKAFLNSHNAANRLITGGWQLSGTFQYASGTPFTIGANGNPLDSYTGNRANVVPGQALDIHWNNYYQDLKGIRTPVFNPAAFSSPGLWAQGGAPRNIAALRNPWSQNENVALAKHLNFTERFSGEIRMEYYDILNRVTVCSGANGPNNQTSSNVDDGNFGLDSLGGACQANTPRQGQVTFKLQF